MGMTGDEGNMMVIILAVFALMLTFVGVAIVGSFRRNEKERLAKEAAQSLKTASLQSENSNVSAATSKTTESAQSESENTQLAEAALSKIQSPALAPEPKQSLSSSQPHEPVEASVKEALKNTEKSFFGRLKGLFKNEQQLQNFEELEEILMTSDLGPQTVTRLLEKLEALKKSEKSNLENLKSALKNEFLQIFDSSGSVGPEASQNLISNKSQSSPQVWMVVGVNGAGKTTTIGKLSAQLAQSGKKVLVAAGDTFRAAASAQLKTWTERAEVEFFSPEGVKDPSAVAFEAVQRAKSQNFDMVIIDTAGRLHTQTNLMEELKKVKRVMTKIIPEAPHEVFIILDANSGQNALYQAREFHQALGLTGVVLTKMDGTAKGGVAVGLAQELKIPIRWIGIGEKVTDLRPFSSQEFVDSILGG